MIRFFFFFFVQFLKLDIGKLEPGEGEIKVRCFNQWYGKKVLVWEALPYLKKKNLCPHVSATQVCRTVSWLEQRDF